jgi:hypothetical protein
MDGRAKVDVVLKQQREQLRKQQAVEDNCQREQLLKDLAAEDERERRIAREAQATADIDCSPWHQYTIGKDGTARVKMRLQQTGGFVYATFDRGDLNKLASFTIFCRQRGNCRTLYLGANLRRGLKYYSTPGRLLLGVDDPGIEVFYVNGDCLDNRRCNLAVRKKRAAKAPRPGSCA